jgi:ribose transport system substrate-binding protein
LFDSAADVPESDYISFVATDNKKGGELAALRMGEICGGKGTVALVPNQANSASTMDRESGFEETLKAKFPEMKVVRASFGEADRSKSMNVAQDILSKNPEIIGIFGSCEPCAIGALKAVEAKNAFGKIKVIGFDNTSAMEKAIIAGQMDSTVVQNPAKMGYESVKALINSKAGKPVEKRIDTGVVILTKETMDKEEMKEFRAKD